MMGTKIRGFAPLPRDVSLEELVPKDSFYRRLEERLDFSFVRELVAPLYAGGGRPSVDPVVFFKLQLVMFFEDLRSEADSGSDARSNHACTSSSVSSRRYSTSPKSAGTTSGKRSVRNIDPGLSKPM